MAGTRVKFPDEDCRTWRTVDDIEMEEVSEDIFQDGLRVVDFERINTRYDENSVCRFFLMLILFSAHFMIIVRSLYSKASLLITNCKLE